MYFNNVVSSKNFCCIKWLETNLRSRNAGNLMVRYERDHSLSAGHMDWTEYNGKQCCVILDDSSRKILAGIECDNAPAE